MEAPLNATPTPTPEPAAPVEHKERVPDRTGWLMNNPLFSDVTVQLRSGGSYRAHKAILVALPWLKKQLLELESLPNVEGTGTEKATKASVARGADRADGGKVALHAATPPAVRKDVLTLSVSSATFEVIQRWAYQAHDGLSLSKSSVEQLLDLAKELADVSLTLTKDVWAGLEERLCAPTTKSAHITQYVDTATTLYNRTKATSRRVELPLHAVGHKLFWDTVKALNVDHVSYVASSTPKRVAVLWTLGWGAVADVEAEAFDAAISRLIPRAASVGYESFEELALDAPTLASIVSRATNDFFLRYILSWTGTFLIALPLRAIPLKDEETLGTAESSVVFAEPPAFRTVTAEPATSAKATKDAPATTPAVPLDEDPHLEVPVESPLGVDDDSEVPEDDPPVVVAQDEEDVPEDYVPLPADAAEDEEVAEEKAKGGSPLHPPSTTTSAAPPSAPATTPAAPPSAPAAAPPLSAPAAPATSGKKPAPVVEPISKAHDDEDEPSPVDTTSKSKSKPGKRGGRKP
jgi:hypothetical protein